MAEVEEVMSVPYKAFPDEWDGANVITGKDYNAILNNMVFWKRAYVDQSIEVVYTYSGSTSKTTLNAWLEIYPYTARYRFLDGANNITLRVKQGVNYPDESVVQAGADVYRPINGYALFLPDALLWHSRFPYQGETVFRHVHHTYAEKRLKIIVKESPDVSLEFSFSAAATKIEMPGFLCYRLGNLYVEVVKGSATWDGVNNILTVSTVDDELCVVINKDDWIKEVYIGELYGFNRHSSITTFVTELGGSQSHLVIRCCADITEEKVGGNCVVYKKPDEVAVGGANHLIFKSLEAKHKEFGIYMPWQSRLGGWRDKADLGMIHNPFKVVCNTTYDQLSFASVLEWEFPGSHHTQVYTDDSADTDFSTMTMMGNTKEVKLFLFDKYIFFFVYSQAKSSYDGTLLFDHYAAISASFEHKIVAVTHSFLWKKTMPVYQEGGATESLGFGGFVNPVRIHKNGSWVDYTKGACTGYWNYFYGDYRGFVGYSDETPLHLAAGAILTNIYPSTWGREFAEYCETDLAEQAVVAPNIPDAGVTAGEETHYAGFVTGLPYRAPSSEIEAILGSPTLSNRVIERGALKYGEAPWYMPSDVKYLPAWDAVNLKYVIVDSQGNKVFEG